MEKEAVTAYFKVALWHWPGAKKSLAETLGQPFPFINPYRYILQINSGNIQFNMS
jgi:hypothetical protein